MSRTKADCHCLAALVQNTSPQNLHNLQLLVFPEILHWPFKFDFSSYGTVAIKAYCLVAVV